MARATREINETEWVLLEVLWRRERGTAREVAEDAAQSRAWAYSTVKTLLDRMVAKQLLSARRVGNVWEYEPAVREVEARRKAWRRFVETAFGGSMAPALNFIANDARLTRKQREALRELLEGEKESPHVD